MDSETFVVSLLLGVFVVPELWSLVFDRFVSGAATYGGAVGTVLLAGAGLLLLYKIPGVPLPRSTR